MVSLLDAEVAEDEPQALFAALTRSIAVWIESYPMSYSVLWKFVCP